MHRRRTCQINIPENTAVIDHVLILKPCSVAEFKHLNRKCILLSLCVKQISNIEGMRIIAVLTVTDLYPIHIQIIGRLHAAQRDINLTVILKHRILHGKLLSVKSYRILFGWCLRKVRTTFKRHSRVRIDRMIKAVAGPACRQCHCLPAVSLLFLIILLFKRTKSLCLFRVIKNRQIPAFILSGQKLIIV